jgi:hypothetical protein
MNMTLEETLEEIDQMPRFTKVLPTKFVVITVAAMFIVVQAAFLMVDYTDNYSWQATGMILSTNFAAIWLAVSLISQIERIERRASTIYRPEILKFANWFYSLMEKIKESSSGNPEKQIEDLAPVVVKVLERYHSNKTRIERLDSIEDDEVFMSAMEEVIR